MMIQCMKNGECYDRYITGSLINPQQRIPVLVNVDGMPESDMFVCAYPLEDTEVKWKDTFGDVHTSYLYKGRGIAVNKKFLVEDNQPISRA